MSIHTPVLLHEAIEALQLKKDGSYIDATVGQGGHLREMVKSGAKIMALDRDKEQIKELESEFGTTVKLIQGNFADIESIAVKEGFAPVDGVLFDYGLSWRQLADSGRGLSYKNLNEPLDMRLDDQADRTAALILKDYTENDLYELFSRNAEEFHSRILAQTIVRSRPTNHIVLVQDLITVVNRALGNCHMKHQHGSDVLARVFQSLRIEVNDEFGAIKKGLDGARKILRPGGRIVTIAFHSLEDRIVKQFIKNNQLQQATKAPLRGDRKYRFSRGAKMRIAII